MARDEFSDNENLPGHPGPEMLPPPRGLYRRVRARLHIIAMIEKQQRRFNRFFFGGTGVAAAIVAVIAFAAFYKDLPQWFARNIPGGMGYYDYVSNSVGSIMAGLAGHVTIVVVFAIALTALLALRLPTSH